MILLKKVIEILMSEEQQPTPIADPLDSASLSPNELPVDIPKPEEVISAPPPLRENLVSQAVNFLTDARVVSEDDNKKRRYLKSKGLTDAEIDASFERAQGTLLFPI